jgi:proteasome lid subunit RPN8/RPN11
MPELVVAAFSGVLPMALAGFGIGMLIAVALLRRLTADKSVVTTPTGEDLLAQAEEDAIALTLSARKSQGQAAEVPSTESNRTTEAGEAESEGVADDESSENESSEDEGSSDESTIDWEEREDVYRPTTVDAVHFAPTLCPERPPEIQPQQTHIFIRQSAYAQLREHLRQDLTVEMGGLLYGEAFYDPGRAVYLLAIGAALAATGGIETPTSFAYTPASWQGLTPRLQQLPLAWTLIGSYHSHPGLGVFLSETDLDTQEAIFAQDWQIALVVDPIADTLGFFVGKDGTPCTHWRIVPDPKTLGTEPALST